MIRNRVSLLSALETAYLTAILLLGDNAFGAAIFDKASEVAAPTKLSYGSLYTTLDRLERQGLLTSQVGKPIVNRGGRGPRYFALTGVGEQALKQAHAFARNIDQSLTPAWAMLGEEPSSAPGGVCNECYKRILQWARDFGLRE